MFVYSIASAANETTSATVDTLDAYLAIRETSQAVWLQTWLSQGKGAALTTLTGIMHRLRLWTTVGTGGSAITPQPTRPTMPAAQTVVVNGALTQGTINGATQLAFGHGAAGPGGWMPAGTARRGLAYLSRRRGHAGLAYARSHRQRRTLESQRPPSPSQTQRSSASSVTRLASIVSDQHSG